MVSGADDDWRRLIKGGFAFDSAPFAGHPLDRRRAENALALAFAQGISPEEILGEAHEHLLTVYSQSSNAAIAEQLDRVKALIKAKQPGQKFRRLWLIFWNSIDDPVNLSTNQLVQAFDPRASETRIIQFLTDFYSSSKYSARELAYFATRKKANPYAAHPIVDSASRLKGYHCGHDPWLEARLCQQIVVHTPEMGKVSVSWSQDSRQQL